MKVSLPIDQHIQEIQTTIREGKNVIISAAPGAGKTTRVPPALIELTSKKIIVLQPRRIAAKTICERIAEENNWIVGKEIGYQVRHENLSSVQTKILVMTEALLIKKFLADPELQDVGIIIFDEFHERTLNMDVSLGLTQELQLLRDDLSMVVMSATLDASQLVSYLKNAKSIDVPGRLFPIQVHYDSQSQRLIPDFELIRRIGEKILKCLETQESSKHILCFLPGVGEIRSVEKFLLEKNINSKFRIFQLHGRLSLEDQKKALGPFEGIKIILSTNVAETSLTINGVNTVIDSGLERTLIDDKKRLFPTLKLQRISLDSAKQRQGRAGREFPGRCFKLWAEIDESSFDEFQKAEIESLPLTDALLNLSHLQIRNFENFSWFEKPIAKNISLATDELTQLKLIDDTGITARGKLISTWPLSAQFASFLIECQSLGIPKLGALTTAILADRDYFSHLDFSSYEKLAGGSDLLARALAFADAPQKFPELSKNLQQIGRLISCDVKISERDIQESSIKALNISLLKIFPHRICRRRRLGETSVVSVDRMGGDLATQSICKNSEFVLALAGRTLANSASSMIDIAHPIEKYLIVEVLEKEIKISENIEISDNGSFFKTETKVLFQMPFEERSRKKLDPKDMGEALVQYFSTFLGNISSEIESLNFMSTRLQHAQKIYPNYEWPKWDENFEKQLIEFACTGAASIQEVKEKNWEELALLLFPSKEAKMISKEFPSQMQAPNGKVFNLTWTEQGVTLSLKIQDCFGWKETPTLANQQLKIKLELLGPNYRPLQTTSDLASFWKNTYQELKGPLKSRYPKHNWPDEPELTIPNANHRSPRRN